MYMYTNIGSLKSKIAYEIKKEEKILEVLKIFGVNIKDSIKNMTLYELSNVYEYGLMGFSIQDSIRHRETNPAILYGYVGEIIDARYGK